MGRRSGGWFEEGLVKGWKKIWWMVGLRSGNWLEEDLVDNSKKVW